MERVKLKELCFMQSGGTPSRNKLEYYNGNIPWAKISDLEISDDGFIYKTEEHITTEGLKSINNRLFKKDTLLLAMYGSVGKTAISKIDLSTNQAILGIKIIDQSLLDIRYLKFWFSTIKAQLLNRAVGAALQNISMGIVKELEIPLPDLPTQQKIAALLDKADELRQYNKQLIQKYDALTQSLFLDMFGDPVRNERGWDKRKLETFGIWKSGGTPSRRVEKYFNGTIPWLSSGELNNMYVEHSKEYITDEAIKNSSTHIIQEGSILLGMYDTAALKSSINSIKLACNQAIAYCKLNNVNTIYVYFVIQYGKEHYKSQQRGVRQKNLNLSIIKNIEINYPPLTLQNQFSERVQLIRQQKEQAQQALQKSEDLFNSLLQKAFKGELVAEYEF